MPFKGIDSSRLPCPIARFRDVVKQRYGVDANALTSRYYGRLGSRQAEEREKVRRTIGTPAAWQAERERFRRDYQSALGPFPTPRVDVIDRGIVDRRDITVRKLLYSSHADNWVPANIYLPKHARGRLPVILSPCGHSDVGKVGYGERAALLALNGYVVFTYDWPGMGERQIPHHETAQYAASTQHNIIGDKMTLAGCSLGWFMVQETMAAVSLLQGLPEVDPDRIGITGSSGGGWLSVHAAAMDERIKVVVPAASVGSFRFQMGEADAEQALFDMQAKGLQYPDLLAFLICPRPVFVVANSHDIWDVKSTEYAVNEAARCYERVGRRDGIRMQVWDKGHAYDDDQLVVAIGWFNRWLKGKPDDPVVTRIELENVFGVADLVVCRSESVFAEGRKTPSQVFWTFAQRELCARKDLDGFLSFLKDSVCVPPSVTWQELDRFVPGAGLGKRICYSPEEGILLPADVLIPDSAKDVVILVDESGRRDDLDWQIQCMGEGHVVLRPDLRGWGEVSPPEDWADWEGWSRAFYDSRWRQLHSLARMTGRNLVLDRARDLMALVSVARAIAPGKKVTVWGRRQGALVALFAGLADPRIGKLILERCLDSFRALMEADLPLYRAEGSVHGLLRWGVDISDLLAAYPGELVRLSTADARGQPLVP